MRFCLDGGAMTNATTHAPSAEDCTPEPARTSGPRVVVGVGLDTRSAHALVRADCVARALGAELVVVHVIPRRWAVGPLIWEGDASAEPALRSTVERARTWCEAILARALPPSSLAFARGPVGPAMLDATGRTEADVVVLGAGTLARHLARRIRCPLLVARAAATAPRIFAFTDFSDPCFPVLRHAAALGRGGGGELTFAAGRARGRARGQRERLLGGIAAEFRGVEVLVSDQLRTDEALLAAARIRCADLVAVASHPTSLRMRAGVDDLGCRVAAYAPSSVLLVPIDGAPPRP